jgi:hypothetical protein
MTSTQVETYANIGDIASADVNLKIILRRCIVPKFFELVGPVAWRRKVATISLVAGDYAKDLPDDYGSMMEVVLTDATVTPTAKRGLTYIGDDPLNMVAAEVNTTRAEASQYYVVRRATTELFKRIRFDCPADHAYTVYAVYYSHIQFTDDTTDVELDKYIPGQFQWALVEGLKAYLYAVRVGIADNRQPAAEAEQSMRIFLANQDREMGRGATPRFVD